MSPSRRAFLKSAMVGTGLAWEGLRMCAEPGAKPEDVIEVHGMTPLETRLPISLSEVQGRRTTEGDLALRPGESVQIKTLVPEKTREFAWRLRLVGEVDVDPRLRTEEGFPPFYRLIDDALDPRTTHHRTYSLALRSSGEFYPRRAYFRVFWNTQTEEREYDLKVWVRKEEVETLPGGRAGIEVAIYQKRLGRNPGDISEPPDSVYFLDTGEGAQDWQERQLPVRLNGDVACLLFTVTGEKFRGGIWLEDSQFPGPDGLNSLPPFAPSRPGEPYRNWLGENLSEKEWPKFRLTLNGKEFFQGKLYQPEYSWPAAEVDLPAGLLRPGENDLTLQLVSDYHQALSYILRHLEWLQSSNGGLEILACPKLVEAGKGFSVLIRTRDPGLQARVEVEPSPAQARAEIAPLQSEVVFPAAGLNFVKMRAGRAGAGGMLKFRFGEEERQVSVERVVERQEDGVLVGSGDSFLVAAEPKSLQRFHTWYLHHSAGNLLIGAEYR